MPSAINKLLLVRVKYVRSNLLSDLGFAGRIDGEPIPVSPLAWRDEAGLSHWGFLLLGLSLKEYKQLKEWEKQAGFATVLELTAGDVDSALAGVGLRVNQSALEDAETPTA